MDTGSLLPIIRLRENEKIEDADVYWEQYLKYARQQMERQIADLSYSSDLDRMKHDGLCGAEKIAHEDVPDSVIVKSPEFAFAVLTLINFSFGGTEAIEAGEYWVRNFPDVADVNLYYYLSLVSYYDSEALYSDAERQKSTLLFIDRAVQAADGVLNLLQNHSCLTEQFKERCDELVRRFEASLWLTRSMRGYFNAEFGGAAKYSIVDTEGAYRFNARNDLFMENHAFAILVDAAEMQKKGIDLVAVQDRVSESRYLYEKAKQVLYGKVNDGRRKLSFRTRENRFKLQLLTSRINSIEERLKLIDEFLDQ